MKPGLFILPFMAILAGALAVAVQSAAPDFRFLTWLFWTVAVALLALWVGLDRRGFRTVFSRKGAHESVSSGVAVVLAILVAIGIAVVTSRPRFNGSIDLTRAGLNTLSGQSLKVIAETEKNPVPINVQAFFSDDQVRTGFRDLLGLYLSHGARLSVDYVDPQTDPAKTLAKNITSGNTVVFSRGQRETRITTFSEEKITNALMHVLKTGSKRVYFTRGHGESDPKSEDPTGLAALVQELANNQYEVHDLVLSDSGSVPDDADMIVIAGPHYDFRPEEISALRTRLSTGGSMLVMIEALVQAPNLSQLLAEFGIRVNSDLVLLAQNDARITMFGQNNAIVAEFDAFHPVSRDFAKQSSVAVVMSNARSLEAVTDNLNKMKPTEIGHTAERFMRVRNVLKRADLQSISQDRVDSGTFATVVASSGKVSTGGIISKAEVRLVAFGSSAFASNRGIIVGQNRDLVMNAANWLLQDEDYLAIRPRDPDKSSVDLTSPGSQLLLAVICFIYPFLFLGGGVAYWVTRRKR